MRVRLLRPSSTRAVEPLEGRSLLAVAIQFDYSLDTANFFAEPERRAALQAAADAVVAGFSDELEAIVPGDNNSWTATTRHPATDKNTSFPNLTIPRDTLLVYAGARQMSSLAVGGPGSATAFGDADWRTLVGTRGQQNATGGAATDFGPWGGSISFDTEPATGWYFGLEEKPGSDVRYDFYSVALHEIVHVLGFGTSSAWRGRVTAGKFTGPASAGEYDRAGTDGEGVPLGADENHWASAVIDEGRETAMDPESEFGRKPLTPLDIAALDDIGWELPLSASLASSAVTAAEGDSGFKFVVNYRHYTRIDLASIDDGDVTVVAPDGRSVPAALMGVVESDGGRAAGATYTVAGADGAVGEVDAGRYAVTLSANAVLGPVNNVARGGPLGDVTLDVDLAPVPSLDTSHVITPGGSSHTVVVRYFDAGGISTDTIDPADVVVARASDGLALAVTGAAVVNNPSGDEAGWTAVAYTVAAPGGSWDDADGGTCLVSLAAGQVTDPRGTAAAAGALGSFDVALAARAFSSGNDVDYTDADGERVVISLKGPGSGQAFFTSPGASDVSQIVLDGTAPSSALTVTARGGGTSVGGLTVNGPLKSLSMKNADLAGAADVGGSIAAIRLRNASGSLTLGQGAPATIAASQVRDMDLTSAAPVKSIKVLEWLDPGGSPDVIAVPSLSSLAVKEAFQADITAGTIGKVTVGGAMTGSAVRAEQSIAGLTVGSIADTSVFAGYGGGDDTLPDSADDFANPAALITALTVKSKAPGLFSNTRISAANLGKVVLGTVATANGGRVFGVAALAVRSVTGATDAAGPLKGSRLDDVADSVTAGDFVLRLL